MRGGGDGGAECIIVGGALTQHLGIKQVRHLIGLLGLALAEQMACGAPVGET